VSSPPPITPSFQPRLFIQCVSTLSSFALPDTGYTSLLAAVRVSLLSYSLTVFFSSSLREFSFLNHQHGRFIDRIFCYRKDFWPIRLRW
jgi:hypothetical protein